MMFKNVLGILADSVKQGSAFILLTPPYSIEFAFIDPRELEAALKREKIERGEFNEVAGHISKLLLAILADHEEATIKQLSEKESPPDVIRDQLAASKASLYSDQLQCRYNLKRSSKAPSFAEIDWDVKIKVEDAYHKVDDFPYATLKLKYQREFSGDPFTLLGGRTFDSVQVNFSGDELEYLQKVIARVIHGLRRRENRGV